MYKNLFNLLTILLILPSCTDMSPNISVVCEENNIGNCILKWETTPLIKGQVKVYTSDNPEFIPEDNPVAMASATVRGVRSSLTSLLNKHHLILLLKTIF